MKNHAGHQGSAERAPGTPRRQRVGAEIVAGGTSFRVWAPGREKLAVVIEGAGEHSLTREADGYFSGSVPQVGGGSRYRFRLDGGKAAFPDPALRFQPEGPHGPSEVVDPAGFPWSDGAWP